MAAAQAVTTGSHANNDDDARIDSGKTGIMVIPRLHLRLKTPTEEDLRKVQQLRTALKGTHFWQKPQHRAWLSDQTLLRFLIAREFHVDKALEMLHTALTWRNLREPHTLTASMEEMQFQGQTGKIYNAGFDRWGRPVVIFNNSVNNSNDPAAQMRFLAFNLETALRKAKARDPSVCKFVIFMHMYDFSLFNCPPFKVTRETIQIVTTCYPETMGHCVIYLPPYVFSAFFDSVKRFIDKRTASKIVMLTGDVSPGSPNDLAMKELIGDDWRTLTGAGQPITQPGCSPGYDFNTYWPRLTEEEARLRASEAAAEEEAKQHQHQHHQHHQHHHRRSHSHQPQAQGQAAAARAATAPSSSSSSSVPLARQAPTPTPPAAAASAAPAASSSSSSSSYAYPTGAGRGPVSRPQSPEQQSEARAAGGSSGDGESKLWRPKRQNNLTSITMVAAASAISAAAAAICVRAIEEDSTARTGGAAAASSSFLLALASALTPTFVSAASEGGSSSGSGSGSGSGGLASRLYDGPLGPFFQRVMPPGHEGLRGEGLVLLSLALLAFSILWAYPNRYVSFRSQRPRARGSGQQQQQAPLALSPIERAPTKAVVTTGKVLSDEARRRR